MRSPLFAIFLVVLIDVIGLTFILPLLPFYAERFGASARDVGLLVATFAAFQLVSGPILGGLSDRYGRRRLLVVSQLGTIAGYVLLGLANTLTGVFLARIVHGATAGNLSLAQAYIADVTEPEDRARAFALIGVAFGIGFLLGPAVSGWLAHKNIHYPVFAAGGLSTLSMLTTLALVKEPARAPDSTPPGPPPETPGAPAYRGSPPAATGRRLGLLEWGTYAGYFKRPSLRGPLLQFFSFAFSFAMFTSGFALFAERRFHWGPREVGYLFAFAGLLGIVLQGGVVAALVKRFGEPAVVNSGLVGLAAGYVVMAFSHDLPTLLVASALSSYGSSSVRPALTSLITRRAHRGEQGTILGLTQSLTSVSLILAPMLSGGLIDRGRLTGWALAAGVASALGLGVRLGEVEPAPEA